METPGFCFVTSPHRLRMATYRGLALKRRSMRRGANAVCFSRWWAVRKQRASKVDSQPVGRRRLHVSSFQEAPLLAQKAASPSCLRKRLRIFTDNHATHLTDREPSHSLARQCGCIFRPRRAVHLLSKRHLISQSILTRTSEPASCSSSSDARSVGECRCTSRSCQAVCDARAKKLARITIVARVTSPKAARNRNSSWPHHFDQRDDDHDRHCVIGHRHRAIRIRLDRPCAAPGFPWPSVAL